MSEFTSGPWTAEQDDVPYDGGFETWVVNKDGASICMMDCPKDDMEANAHLIAAAPDLLAALEANHEWHLMYDEHDSYQGSELWTKNTQAIAKARGEVEQTPRRKAGNNA